MCLKEWFARHEFTVEHISGKKNLIPDFLSRPAKKPPDSFPVLITSSVSIPLIAMANNLLNHALTKRTFPNHVTFSSPYQIRDYAKRFLLRYFHNISRESTDVLPSFHPEQMFLIGLNLEAFKPVTENQLWFMWCLSLLYATKLVLPVRPTLCQLNNLADATSLLWTLLEWFSPISWWRKQLTEISNRQNLDNIPSQEANLHTFVFIVHRPYFQHPETLMFWTQDQVYEW